MTILYLYSELMGYQIPVFKEYVTSYNAKVHVVHWNHKKLTPYVQTSIEGDTYYNRSDFDIRMDGWRLFRNLPHIKEKWDPHCYGL